MTSLERLKALDSLPNLEAQLREITQLCTHSARVEMIARWLFGKLQSDFSTRRNEHAWDSLLSTFRLLPPERIATLLGASKVLKVMQNALGERMSDEDFLKPLSNLLRFLLEQSQAAAGAPLRAGLRLPMTEAAEFVGLWLSNCRGVASKHPEQDLSDEIGAALQIWALRRTSIEENEDFSKHCLAPCVASLRSTARAQDNAPVRKRKLGAESGQNVYQAIEALLAKHIFLPGRAAFLKTSASSNHKTRNVGSQRPSFVLEGSLEPLKTTLRKESIDETLLPSSLPQLLDIALRSSPAPSPRHRSQEQHWLEALFSALHELNTDSEGRIASSKALSSMLDVLAQRSRKLSSPTLKDIVERHAGLDVGSDNNADWKLIAAVVNVDASFFVESRTANLLFDAITGASIRYREDAVSQGMHSALRVRTNEVLDPMHILWRDRIIVPVLKAFADHRKLDDFVEMWAHQLEKDKHGTFWSVWNHLDEHIQQLLETSLTDDQVLSLCQHYCETITRFSDESQTNDIPKLSTAVVVLSAMLPDIRSERVLEKMHHHLEATFSALIKLHETHVGPALLPALQERRCWSLMTTIFELWFPRWSVQESDPSAVVGKIDCAVPRIVLDRAMGLTSAVHPEEYGTVEDPRSAADAKAFAVCVCTKVLAYEKYVGEEVPAPYREVLNGVVNAAGLSADALILYPDALSFMDASSRNLLLRSYIKGVTKGSITNARDWGVLRSVVSASVALNQPRVIDNLVSVALDTLSEMQSDSGEEVTENVDVVTQLLSEFPARALTRPQRERTLDKMCELDVVDVETIKARLALMLRLMELPNPTARICHEATAIAKMAKDLDHIAGGEHDAVVAAFFEALVSLIIQQCIKTKDQERNQMMLVDLSAEAKKIINSFAEPGTARAQSALVRTAFKDLDAHALDGLKPELAHVKSSTVKSLLKNLASSIHDSLQKNYDDVFLLSLDLLRAIPARAIASSGSDVGAVLASLATFLEKGLTDSQGKRDADGWRSSAVVMVACYETLGKLAPSTSNVEILMFADRLLQLPLGPREHATVFATFKGLLASLGPSRVALLQELLSDGMSLPGSRLLLISDCVDKLEKADFDDFEDYSPTKVLYSLIKLASGSNDFTTSRRSVACITDILKSKPFMANQYSIECTLQTLHHLTQRSGVGKNILYLDICATLFALLLHHRSRLQGRFHMVIKLLQALLSRLFEPLSGFDPATEAHPPTSKHAAAFSRLLKSFCEPPQHRKPSTSLIDESRKEQAHVGTFVQHVLHHYCTQILHGTLGEGMRDALVPGLRAMIEAMEMGGREGGKSLSAAMSDGERAVLRGLFEDWRRFGKWRGG